MEPASKLIHSVKFSAVLARIELVTIWAAIMVICANVNRKTKVNKKAKVNSVCPAAVH